MKRILLTGATGYLGNHLCRRLLKDGYSVLAIYLNHKEEMVYDKEYENNIKKIYLCDTSIEEIFNQNKIDGIIHTSTLYGRLGETKSEIIKSNIIFPVEILDNAIKNNVEFFINTDTILNKHVSPYALTKSNFTEWMRIYEDNIKLIDIKLDHFYGPKDKSTKFISYVLEKLLKNEEKIDLTEGSQTRDFIFIDDVIEVYCTVLDSMDKMELGQIETFEVGTNNKTTIRYVIETLKKLTGSNTKLNFGALPFRKYEILDYDVNTTAIRLLGWEPKINIDKGLEIIVAAAKEERI